MRNPRSSLYDFVIRSLPVVFITGVVTVLIGAYTKHRWLLDVGIGVFFAGGAIWGLANGGFFLWLFVRAARKMGIRYFAADFSANPFKSALLVLLTIFLIAAGVGFSWCAWRAFVR